MSQTETKPEAAATPAPQPLFYRQPEALSATRHGDLRLRQRGDFAFARDTNSVAVTASEFAAVARDFPIVFAGENHFPAAVLGLESDNLFLDADGKWAEGAYIPAYLRRYPFVFIGLPDGKGHALGIDRACERVVSEADGDTLALFAEGKPTAITDEALRFCIAFQNDHEATRAFAAALAEQKLLVEAQYASPVAAGKFIALKGFHVVDQARFQTLSDAVVLDWHRKGWLALVHFHLASQDHWKSLSAKQVASLAKAA